MTTKEQERKALEKIRRIIAEMGDDSYIATAFEGCIEDAEQNIEYDFGCSMKQRYESEKETADHFKTAAEHFSAELDKAQDEIAALKEQVKTLEAKLPQADDLEDCISLAQERRSEYEQQMDDAARKIVEHADEADGAEFQQAVRDHRNAKRAYEYTQGIIDRLIATR